MKMAGAAKKDEKKKKKTTHQPLPLGMEDTLSLLLSLIPRDLINGDFDPENPKQLDLVIGKVFDRLDVDGSGGVSWWEWKHILSASLQGRNPLSKYIDPRDPLSVLMAAGQDALTSHPRSRPPGKRALCHHYTIFATSRHYFPHLVS